MKHIPIFIAGAAALAVLAACTEQTQTIGTAGRVDTAAFQGTGMPFAAPGWKQGDKTSWEQQLKTRLQMGQNDYAKIN
ncbi:MAG: hypothetical protein NDJ19_11125 [Ramlibacter sp.]|nr:hypothetical protein [Ramlibacter sp.]